MLLVWTGVSLSLKKFKKKSIGLFYKKQNTILKTDYNEDLLKTFIFIFL